MFLPNPKDALHKAELYRLLSAISDDVFLNQNLMFKGGTCASMQGYLNRFSVDLDFDLLDKNLFKSISQHLEKIFEKLELQIKAKSVVIPQYFLKYRAPEGSRNTIKIDMTFPAPKSNQYEPIRFRDIDRIIHCQTLATMVSNKLVATLDRWKKHHFIAGRDIYDIHYFLLNGYVYLPEIIEERTNKKTVAYFKELIKFIEKHFNQKIIDQDLNMLLEPASFQRIRKTLKHEVLIFLRDELLRKKPTKNTL